MLIFSLKLTYYLQALMQYEQVIITTGAPGTTSHNKEGEAGPWACENGLLVDGYKVESTCTFAC